MNSFARCRRQSTETCVPSVENWLNSFMVGLNVEGASVAIIGIFPLDGDDGWDEEDLYSAHIA